MNYKLWLVLSAFVALSACGDSSPPPPKTQAKAPVATFKPVALKQEAAQWPPPAPANLPVAENLLADNWVVVFDRSGSMGGSACGTGNESRAKAAQKAVIKFNGSIPGQANRGLVVFPDPKIWVELGPNNRAEFDTQVNKITVTGGTPLRSSMRVGAEMLTKQAQRQRGYGSYHLVVVTDGEADQGENPSDYTKELVKTTAIAVHVIGFCVDGKHSLDIKGYTQYAGASNPEALEKGLRAILAESETFSDSVTLKQ